MKKKIAIIGAGISGLIFANLLKQNSKYDFTIFEKNSSLNLSEGYGVQLSVNSASILNEIGFKNFKNDNKFNPKKIDFYSLKNNNKIYYLKDVNSQDLFTILNYSSYIVCPHGLITHISRFLNKDSLNLFNFSINSNKDIAHEKISFSEWYLNMNLNFIFLNKDINKSISKISKFI